jgi:hypothetical protein
MPRSKPPVDKTPKQRATEQPPDEGKKAERKILEDKLLAMTGAKSQPVRLALINRALRAMWIPDHSDTEAVSRAMDLAIFTFAELKPRDAAEGMLAAQMIASHEAAMECMRRAMLPNQTFEGRDQNLKHATKLMGLYERQLAALDKHRGKGRQKITVEHVNVHAGGQAIVGDVTTGAAATPVSPSSPLPSDPPNALADETASSSDGEELRKSLGKKTPASRPRKP